MAVKWTCKQNKQTKERKRGQFHVFGGRAKKDFFKEWGALPVKHTKKTTLEMRDIYDKGHPNFLLFLIRLVQLFGTPVEDL